jgi:gliding motility-associated-like protein
MEKNLLLPIKNNFFKNDHSLRYRFIIIFFLLLLASLSFSQSRCGLTHSYSISSPTCFGSANASINLTMNGGTTPYIYSWSTGATSEDINGLVAGVYNVLVIDQNGCRDSAAITVTQPSKLINTIQKQDVSCYGGNNGLIITHVTGGVSPYNYFWSNGFQNANINNLTAGAYFVTIYDYRGCSRRDTIKIEQPDPINITLISPEPVQGYNVSGYSAHDGSIDQTVSGGVAPYVYAWSNGANTQDISGLTANTYNVTVTDLNSCSASASITLDQPLILEMPSGFTPNGDGANDNFIVHGAAEYPDNVLTIFNRWGNIVYMKENYQDQWNGYNNKGDELPDGTYFAIMEIKSKDLVLKGYVEMKRH